MTKSVNAAVGFSGCYIIQLNMADCVERSYCFQGNQITRQLVQHCLWTDSLLRSYSRNSAQKQTVLDWGGFTGLRVAIREKDAPAGGDND